MRNRIRLYAVACGLVMGAGWWAPAGWGQEALSTAFTYQGQLKLAGAPVNAACDLRFRLWDAEAGGTQAGPMQEHLALPVAGGLFAVALDFGAVFGDRQLWLETAVAHPAGSGAWVTLAPRQALFAAPQALFALGAAWSGLTGRPVLLGSLDGVTSDLGDIDLVAGPNIAIEPDPANHRITISATGAAAGGDITGVLAGAGLTGGAAAGDATLALGVAYLDGSAFDGRFVNESQAGGITATMLADGSVSLAKLEAGILDWANLGGIPAGLADGVDADTTYSAGAGLLLAGTVFSIPAGGVTDAMVAGLSWGKLTGVPADLADGDQDTLYAAGSGLNLFGTTFSVDFTSVSSSAHKHPGEHIVSGTVGATYIDGALARDSEVLGLVLAGDGAGSGLDADRLDGLDAAAFALTAHAHAAGALSVVDEFAYSDATTVQDVLDDLDAAITAGGGAQNLFETVATPDGALLAADSVTDVLTFAAGPGIEVTGDGATDTLTIGLADGGVTLPKLAAGVLSWANLGGVPAGFADGTDNDSGGDITEVVAGDGLSGGAGSGAAALQVGAGTGIAVGADSVSLAPAYADGSAFDARFVNEGQAGSVTDTMVAGVAWGKLSGVPADLADGDQNTTYSAGAGLTLAGTVFGLDFGAVAAAAHTHAGEDLSSGTVAEARIHGALARDAEVPGLVLAADGSGSGLDADLLDGLDSATFALSGHAHAAAGVGVMDEFEHSDATTVQDVLDDLDAAITAGSGVQNLFETVATPDGALLVADTVQDVLSLAAGMGLAITGDADADRVTVGLSAGYAEGVAYDARFVNEGQTGSVTDPMIVALAWGKLSGVPADLADGDQDTTYTFGPGLSVVGTGVDLVFGGNGIAAAVARSDHSHTVTWGDLAGVPAGFADGTDNDSGGDVTGVTAGDGLTGGGDAGALALHVGAGTGISVDGDTVSLHTAYATGSVFDARFVNATGDTLTGDLVGLGEIAARTFRDTDNPGSYLDPQGSSVLGSASFSGLVSASGGTSAQWTAAYGWGDHGTAGYLTSAQADLAYVNEGQADSVTTAMIVPNVISTICGVGSDGGNVELVPGSRVSLDVDSVARTITINALPELDLHWNVVGNAGTADGAFLGTTDNQKLVS